MQVYDFSTLYTNLDLNEVKKSLFELFDLLFSESNKYICIGLYTKKCFFAKKKYNGFYCLDIDEFKDAIEFILQNTYITFGGLILQQAKGIPMGGNCSSQIADLFLCYREYIYMTSLLSDKRMGLAKLLSDNSRYVDDLSILNYRNFSNLIADIYPEDLVMERSGDDDKDILCYLDVRITIGDDELTTEVYNKVDDFTFPVVMFTFPSGNIPIQLGYDVFFGQIQRYAIICSKKSGFLYVSNKIFTTLCERGYSRGRLITKFKRIFQRDPFILYKYGFLSVQQAEMELISFINTVEVVTA